MEKVDNPQDEVINSEAEKEESESHTSKLQPSSANPPKEPPESEKQKVEEQIIKVVANKDSEKELDTEKVPATKDSNTAEGERARIEEKVEMFRQLEADQKKGITRAFIFSLSINWKWSTF